jgi:hypothetical protein
VNHQTKVSVVSPRQYQHQQADFRLEESGTTKYGTDVLRMAMIVLFFKDSAHFKSLVAIDFISISGLKISSKNAKCSRATPRPHVHTFRCYSTGSLRIKSRAAITHVLGTKEKAHVHWRDVPRFI